MAKPRACPPHHPVINVENNPSEHSQPLTTQPLTTEFVHITLELELTGIALRNHIETQLSCYGRPLRWAITSVDGTTAHVEAVVTKGVPN